MLAYAVLRTCFVLALLLPGTLFAQVQPYAEPYRPQVHFSPRQNWTNDPNGLVFFHGEYHLFFQHNPFGDQWGHMSWGHAVSRDLLHWQQLPVALPEEGNTMIFTGSVVVDRTNSSGFCAAGTECLVAIYTGHTNLGQEDGHDRVLQTQDLAWSRDNGRTWTKYSGNPVLDLHMADFRDPSVSWDEHARHWVMAVALPKEHKVRLYSSPDLKRWTALSDFGPAGSTAGDWECPDLLHVPSADGKGPGAWALKVGINPGAPQGGSGEQYFLGTFDGTRFQASTSPGSHGWTNYGKDDYCAISFNGLAAAEKPVLLGWMSNWQYAGKLPTAPWRGQFSLPRRLSVLHDSAGLVLRQEPVIAPLRGEHHAVDAQLTSAGKSTTVASTHAPFELSVRFDEEPAATAGIRLRSDSEHYTEIGFDGRKHTIYIDRTHAGLPISPDFPGRVETPALPERPFDLHLVVDTSSVELYAQNGTAALTDLVFPSSTQVQVELFTEGNGTLTTTGEWWPLHSIWRPSSSDR